MRAINKVVVSGDVRDKIRYGETPDGTPACNFWLVCDRSHIGSSGGARDGRRGPSATVKVNVYGGGFVEVCRKYLRTGEHVLVDGELMNRNRNGELLIEVRAHELLFYS